MAVVRCDKGHYYDDEKFTQCPHCGVLPVMQPEKPVKPKRFNFFHKDKDGAGRQTGAAVSPVQQTVPPQTPPPYDDRTVGISSPAAEMDDNRTVAFSQGPGASYPEDDNRTIAFSQNPGPSYPDDDNRTIAFSHTPEQPVPEDDNRTIAFSHTPAQPVPEDDNRTIAFSHTPEQPVPEDDNRTIAFSHTPEQPVPEDDNRTIAFSHTQPAPAADDDNRTIAFTAPKRQDGDVDSEDTMPAKQLEIETEPELEIPEQTVQPPVSQNLQMTEGRFAAGWLVCVKGAERGLDFRLYKGFNRIGTCDQADIRLTEEEGNEILCAVVYDDRSNQFYVVQQSETPAYRNEDVIQGAMELHGGDVLRLGTSEFEFVPFCRDGRTWDMEEA